jgi:glycosyltransferase involved in cell wall biosynthesis
MNTNKIYISLVITNYNRAKYIDRAIRSCLGQFILGRQSEVIVVDDCSSDDSLDVIREFGPEIQLFINEENKGVAHTSNVALQHARGEYWMRVDADDYLNSIAGPMMAALLDENPDIAYVYCDHYRVDNRGFKISKVRLDSDEALFEHGAGILFRTSILKEIDGYDESLRNCEDYDLLLRLRKQGHKGYYLPIPLYRYYIHGENITLQADRQTFRKIVEKKHGI